MKRLYFLTLALALSACGKDDTKASVNSLLDGNAPNVTVPADAVISDYSCNEVNEYTDARGEARHYEYADKGVSSYWKDNGYSYMFDEDNNGQEKFLSKYQKVTLENSQYRKTSERTAWNYANGAWSKSTKNFVQIWEKRGNILHNLSNIVDGVETPYNYQIESIEINSKTSRTVQTHLNPSLRDKEGIHYTKIEITCFYIDR